MRVVHLIGDMGLGGAQRQLRHVASRAGHTVLTWRPGAHPLAEGLHHVQLPKARRLDPGFVPRLRATLAGLRPQVVHAWLASANAWAALASCGAPWALVTGEYVTRTPAHGLWPHFVSRAAVSDSAAAAWRIRARIVPPGIAVETPGPRPPRAPTEPFALVLGTLHPDKGQLDAVRAAKQAGVSLALVGGIANAAYAARVIAEGGRWYGSTLRPADWLAAASVVVLPSHSESAPNVLLEALALGCAVIATRVGDVEALTDHGRLGALVPAGNVDALARCLRDPPGRAVDGPAWVSERFNVRKMLDALDALYGEVS